MGERRLGDGIGGGLVVQGGEGGKLSSRQAKYHESTLLRHHKKLYLQNIVKRARVKIAVKIA